MSQFSVFSFFLSLTLKDPSIEDSYRKAVFLPGESEPCLLEILNLAGSPGAVDFSSENHFSSLAPHLIRFYPFAIVVFSVLSRISFERACAYVEHIKRVWKKEEKEARFVLVGNKIDMRPVSPDAITTKEGESLAKSLGALRYFETSAKTFEGIETMFVGCVSMMKEYVNAEELRKDGKEEGKCILS